MIENIIQKRNGGELSSEAIQNILHSFVKGEIPDYQMAALLMAIYYRGFSAQELSCWTRTMMCSGKSLDLSEFSSPKIDKHSTGGVGDKTSLIVAPLVASLGVMVPMICGRSLGFTGGTVDKLESISGFQTSFTLKEAKKILKRVGVIMMAQSEEIAPADRKLYALRDVTATVESIPLIASSIVSKKAAEGIGGVVFDVKFGDGAFLQEASRARMLAKELVQLSKQMKLKSVAVLSSMDEPLGDAIGNSVEIEESIQVLKGNGPQDVRKLSLLLSAWMLVLAKKTSTLPQAMRKVTDALDQGLALRKFRELLMAQGGDVRVIEEVSCLPQPQFQVELFATTSGFLNKIHTRKMGDFLRGLGAGRLQLKDKVDPSVGIRLFKKVGDSVKRGERLALLQGGKKVKNPDIGLKCLSLFEVGLKPVKPTSLLGGIVR